PVPQGTELDKILCIRIERTVRNDNTITYNGTLYQIDQSLMSKKVTIQQRLNGTMRIVSQDKAVAYHQITTRPETTKQPVLRKKRKPTVVPHNHPWRKFDINRFKGKSPQTVAV